MAHHDTDETLTVLKHYLEEVLPLDVNPLVFGEDEHDGRDGKPVAAVEVDGLLMVYPIETDTGVASIKRWWKTPTNKRLWAIDVMVDDSDPSVGLYGSVPEEHSTHNSLFEAVCEIAAILVRHKLCNVMAFETEMEYVQELEDMERAAYAQMIEDTF